MTVDLFGATLSPSCAAFALRQAAVDYGPEFEPYVAYAVEKSFYVDGCLLSFSREIGIKLAKNLISLSSKAGFRFTTWISNNQKVINTIPEEERSKCLTVGVFNHHTSKSWNKVKYYE